ncbi:unannotated protein [freshwater metagenome]|uniref:Unannotated protein n=1 Tax=freshwater metagenome TaxID=449393 RepID=A0A6J6F7V4_9ZZZZ
MLGGCLLLVDDLEEPAVETVDDLAVNRELYITADGMTECIGPVPAGADERFWCRCGLCCGLWCVDIGQVNYERGTCNQLAEDRQCHGCFLTKIREVVELDTAPLRGPAGARTDDGTVELHGRLSLRWIQPTAVLKTIGDDAQHRCRCCGHCPLLTAGALTQLVCLWRGRHRWWRLRC